MKLPLFNSKKLLPVGTHIMLIYNVVNNYEFGKLEVYLVTAKGEKHIEKYNYLDKDGNFLEKPLTNFGYLAKAAMNDFRLNDIEPETILGKYVKVEAVHNTKDDNTFVNLKGKYHATGFEEEPVKWVAELQINKKEPINSNLHIEDTEDETENLFDILE